MPKLVRRLWPLEGMGCGVAGRGQIIFWEGQHEGSAPLRNSRSRRSMTGAAAGKQNQRLRFLPFCIGQVAVAKRRAALLAGLRLARRRLPSEQFRSASMTCRPRCGRLSVRQHGSVSCWWSLLGGRPHVGHEAAAVHHAAWRRGGRVAARGARAATGDAGDRISQQPISTGHKQTDCATLA